MAEPEVYRDDFLVIEDWSARLRPAGTTLAAVLSEVQDVVVHKTGSDHSTPEISARYHQQHCGWPSIGYHYYVCAVPELREGRLVVLQTLPPFLAAPARAPATHHRLQVALVGRYTAPLGHTQRLAFALLVEYLSQQHQLQAEAFVSHAMLCPGRTRCPGPEIVRMVAQLHRGRLQALRRIPASAAAETMCVVCLRAASACICPTIRRDPEPPGPCPLCERPLAQCTCLDPEREPPPVDVRLDEADRMKP